MKKIIFFDSECGMCDKFIVYLNKIDKKDELIFCSLKSDFASNFFKEKHNKLSFESIDDDSISSGNIQTNEDNVPSKSEKFTRVSNDYEKMMKERSENI